MPLLKHTIATEHRRKASRFGPQSAQGVGEASVQKSKGVQTTYSVWLKKRRQLVSNLFQSWGVVNVFSPSHERLTNSEDRRQQISSSLQTQAAARRTMNREPPGAVRCAGGVQSYKSVVTNHATSWVWQRGCHRPASTRTPSTTAVGTTAERPCGRWDSARSAGPSGGGWGQHLDTPPASPPNPPLETSVGRAHPHIWQCHTTITAGRIARPPLPPIFWGILPL